MSDNSDVQSAMEVKVRALLRKAHDPAATAAERESYSAKAAQLIAKYHLVAGSAAPVDDKIGEVLYGKVPGSYAMALQQIVTALAKAHGVMTWYSTSGRPGDPARYLYLYGFRSDTDQVRTLAGLFIEDAKYGAARIKTNDPNTTINKRKSFMYGYAATIGERFAKATAAAEAETADTRSMGLVLVDRSNQVADSYKVRRAELGLRRGRGSSTSIDGSAYAQGQAAGRSSNVGRSGVRASAARTLSA